MNDNTPVNEKVKAAIETITRELNGSSKRGVVNGIMAALQDEHRTLQQAFWSVMVQAICRYADFGFDLRNAAAVQWARDAKENAVRDNRDMGFPYI